MKKNDGSEPKRRRLAEEDAAPPHAEGAEHTFDEGDSFLLGDSCQVENEELEMQRWSCDEQDTTTVWKFDEAEPGGDSDGELSATLATECNEEIPEEELYAHEFEDAI